jgi:hypothetical protein
VRVLLSIPQGVWQRVVVTPDMIPHDEMMLRVKEWLLAGEPVLLRGDFLVFHTKMSPCEGLGYRKAGDTWFKELRYMEHYWFDGTTYCSKCPFLEDCREGHGTTPGDT